MKSIESLLAESASGNYAEVLEVVLAGFGCVTGTIHRLNPDSQLLELKAQQGVPEFLIEKIAKIPLGKGIAGAAGEQRAPVQMCNLQTDTSGVARPDAKKTQVAGSLAVPILDGDQLKGTLGIGMREPYDFNPNEVALLDSVANWLAPKM